MGDDDDDYYSIQERGTNSKVNFTPDKAGTYYIMVTVSDSSGQSTTEYFTVEVTAPELYNESGITSTELVLGESTVITAAASGGVAPYKYGVFVKKSGDSSSTTLQDYSTNNMITFQPETTGVFTISVIACDSIETTSSQTFTVTVTAPALKNESMLSADTVATGEKVTITAKASGGTAPYNYAYYYKRSVNTKWNKLSYGNEKGTYAKFTPTTAAEYDIKVVATDANNTKAEKIFKLTAE